MVLEKTHQEYATYFIRSYPTFKHNSSMCRDIAQLIGDKISVVDVVLWRYATLDKNYLQLFSEAGLRKASRGDYGFCWLERGESNAIP